MSILGQLLRELGLNEAGSRSLVNDWHKRAAAPVPAGSRSVEFLDGVTPVDRKAIVAGTPVTLTVSDKHGSASVLFFAAAASLVVKWTIGDDEGTMIVNADDRGALERTGGWDGATLEIDATADTVVVVGGTSEAKAVDALVTEALAEGEAQLRQKPRPVFRGASVGQVFKRGGM